MGVKSDGKQSYLSKCHGILEIEGSVESLTVSNSVLPLFLKGRGVTTYMDAQDVEELLLNNGPFEISFTSENQVTSITDVSEVVQASSFGQTTQELQHIIL